MSAEAVTILAENASAMQTLGSRIAAHLRVGDVLLLHGDLGAGKTTLTQGVAWGLGIAGAVASPTFTLVNEYVGSLPVRHIDLYRLDDEEEVAAIGYAEMLDDPTTVTIVEWPERAPHVLPGSYVLVEIFHAGDGARRVVLNRHGDAGAWIRFLESGS